MTTETSQFFAILTAIGEAKQANANALGVPWTFSSMGVGDANCTEPIPDRLQTRLINERRVAPLNEVKIDPSNSSIIIAEQVIPPDAGGWWIREIGIYDADDDLVAVANCAPSFKPLLNQGTGKTQVVRLNIIVTSTANIQLKIDPSVVLATREYIETVIMTVLPPTRPAGTYTKVHINNRGVVTEGENPTTLQGYGIILASQQDAEALQDHVKPMTAMRVLQSINKVVAQATESAFGWLKIATQAQVDVGTDDKAAVTPKKMRGGFGYSFGTNSFIALPTWMGGLIVQWGAAVSDETGIAVVTLPSTFPSGSFQVIPAVLSASFSTYSVNRASSNASSFTAMTSSGNVAIGSASFGWLAIGR